MPENKVVSKYFSAKTVMDESLSDFQEIKKSSTGPRKVKKSTTNKKLTKRSRRQNDIRVLMKKKENDEIKYSKDFNKVCMQTGVDVDSEELQLAIALSKSLNEVESTSHTVSNSKYLTSQQRTLKIKTTLQEYGFRIPKINLSTKGNNIKKHRKQYKLLCLTQTEKQQLISDKYSEVLAVNIVRSPDNDIYQSKCKDNNLYYKTTNIEYEFVKNNTIYFVKDLFVKTYNKPNLLRDWSEIPGRPLSPTVPSKDINFDDITCNQHDLDCILSGTISKAQHIISNIVCNNNINIKSMEKYNNLHEYSVMETNRNHMNCNEYSKKSLLEINKGVERNCSERIMTVSQQARCISPDLFEDEVSLVLEHTKNTTLQTKIDSNQTFHMDLTDCVDFNYKNSNKHDNIEEQATHEINVTNRKSNDFMEITNCVASNSEKENNVYIDLTQDFKINSKTLSETENIEFMDLTQVSDKLASPSSAIKDTSLDNTIILLDNNINLKPQDGQQSFILNHLSEPIYIDNLENCEKHYKTKRIESLSSHLSNNIANEDNVETIVLENEHNNPKENYIHLQHDHTQNNCSDLKVCNNNLVSNPSIITCDINYDCDKNLFINTEDDKFTNDVIECPLDNIDLTQSSNSNETNIDNLSSKPISNYSNSLGKRDNISIDYDEIFDDILKQSKSQTSLKSFNETQNEKYFTNTKSIDSENDIMSNFSESSEVFEISDKELNYSLHQTEHDPLALKCISNMKNSLEKGINNYDIMNRSMSESNIHHAIISKNVATEFKDISQSQGEPSTPMRMTRENIGNVLRTPKNDDYIIKTDKVTPMLDYASMSSPERHKELEKYGLKPFKRKRAIQLLTYLYNQTHPIVETQDDDCQSPSKRLKMHDEGEQYSSETKLSLTRKLSLDYIPEDNNTNDLYAVTKECPDIRDIECHAEDWFFQKREKAKVRSCRVPLHISFHNYVSCRRRLKEAILCYEPVNIDVIHKDLVKSGFRYNPKDLLRFLDKKCITVRTADTSSRNRKS